MSYFYELSVEYVRALIKMQEGKNERAKCVKNVSLDKKLAYFFEA